MSENVMLVFDARVRRLVEKGEGERALFLSIVAQAITDAVCDPSVYGSKEGFKLATLNRDKARAFLNSSNERFCLFCDLAGLEPSRVLTLTRELIADAERKHTGGVVETLAHRPGTGGGVTRKVDQSQNFFADSEA